MEQQNVSGVVLGPDGRHALYCALQSFGHLVKMNRENGTIPPSACAPVEALIFGCMEMLGYDPVLLDSLPHPPGVGDPGLN